MTTKTIDWTAPAAKPFPGCTIVEEFVTQDGRTRYSLQVHEHGKNGAVVSHRRCDNRRFKSQYGKPFWSLEATGPIEYCRRQFEQIRKD